MSTRIVVELPPSLKQRLDEHLRQSGVSADQFAVAAVREKLSRLADGEYLERRAVRGDRQRFLDVLANVPDTEPCGGDE